MKKIEFSKIITLLTIIMMLCIGVWSIITYYSLTKLAIEVNAEVLPDSAIPIACITTILSAILSYCLYQFGLKNSRNKYGIDANGEPFQQKCEALEEESVPTQEFPEQTPVDCDYKGD